MLTDMKKTILLPALLLLIFEGSAFAQTLTFTNTFGGNVDNLSSSDFIRYLKDENDEFQKKKFSIGERAQLDLSSPELDGRIRLDLASLDAKEDEDENFSLDLKGYLSFKPVSFATLLAGNSFFSKFVIPASYLPANDEYTIHGKLTGADGAGILLQAAGIRLGAATEADEEAVFNFGASYELKNAFNIGATVQNITDKAGSFGVFAGFDAIYAFKVAGGYIRNYKGAYLQNTKDALQLSLQWILGGTGFSAYAEGLLGLTNDIGDGSGNRYFDTKFPWYTAVRLLYKLNEDTSFYLKGTAGYELKSSKAGETLTRFQLYPHFDHKTSMGTFRSGVRFSFTDKRQLTAVSIPVSWYYSFKVK